MRPLLCALIATAIIAPALAADGFYIVRDPISKRCTVVNQRPTLSPNALVGDGSAYRTRDEAEAAMKTAGACAKD
jgi:hypothetical protein